VNAQYKVIVYDQCIMNIVPIRYIHTATQFPAVV